MRFLNTTLPTGPMCDGDARVGTRVFCSKGLLRMYDCMYYSVTSDVELEGAELIRGIFLPIYLIYRHNSLLLERTENVVVMSLGADLP